jgi:effector-binding domain-containing protein
VLLLCLGIKSLPLVFVIIELIYKTKGDINHERDFHNISPLMWKSRMPPNRNNQVRKTLFSFAVVLLAWIAPYEASALETIQSSNPPERCAGYGNLQSISLTDWETGLQTWSVGTRSVVNPATFSTPDWAVVESLPDARSGQAAFVANLDIGNCGDDDETGVLYLESPPIVILGGAQVPRISIDHWFDTEFGWDLVGRYFGLMFDRIVGTDYDKGLANLKELAESMPGADWSGLDMQIVIVDSVPMAYSDGNSSWDRDDIAEALGTAYSHVRAFMGKYKLDQSGPPLAVTRLATEEEWHFEAGIPLIAAPVAEPTQEPQVFVRDTYAGRAIRVIHVGSYDEISDTIEKIDAYIALFGLEKNGNLWEEWISDPGMTPEDRLITNICVPIR